jgi:hypothetical protein
LRDRARASLNEISPLNAPSEFAGLYTVPLGSIIARAVSANMAFGVRLSAMAAA